MSTKNQLELENRAMSDELASLRSEVERLRSDVPAEKSAIVGYYVLATQPARTSELWDGELHPTFEAATRSLESHFNQSETAGFSVYECRRIAPASGVVL
ncbi:hypothetical protein [Rhodococcoides fascians]|uniref:hypothetical protein n=1 Tax=Rhodococcoides fascians TaxID=1828 RepID=UPI00050CA39E|nr:hypothetical protein [Rhodococcus fascians]